MEIDKELIEKIVKQILSEHKQTKIKSFKPLEEKITEADRLDTKNPEHRVYTKDLMNLSESPNLGFGIMEMEKTTFDWTLNYDEIDVVLEGSLNVLEGDFKKTAQKNEAIYIPKGSSIKFSAPEYAKFLYITYPADWQGTASLS